MNTTIIYSAYRDYLLQGLSAIGDYLLQEVVPYLWDMYPGCMWYYHTRIGDEGLYRKGHFACRLCGTGPAAKRRERPSNRRPPEQQRHYRL